MELIKHIRNGLHFIVSLLMLQSVLFAQGLDAKFDTKLMKAEEFFDQGNYLAALPIYKEIQTRVVNNKYVMAKLSLCYLKTNSDRTEPVKLLEKLVQDKDAEHITWYYLGKAYHLVNRIDDAIEAFEKYKTFKLKKSELENTNRQIEMCNTAKTMLANPKNITFINLGAEVNSEFPDYYPFINEDETFLVFTSRRKSNIGGGKIESDGYRPSDVWYTKVENSKWIKSFNAGRTINTSFDELCVGLSPKGDQMVVYIDRVEIVGDLYTSEKTPKGEFNKLQPLPEIINDKKAYEIAGCYAPDKNTFFFVRREKINTQSDIYMCKKLPNGEWGTPTKLPDIINTPYNEEFPYVAPDGVTFYFSSEGHNSMGGYDLFKSTWNQETNTFTTPENLGYPINSTDDNMNISITADNRVGYVSAFRPNGMGDLDIYRIKFNDSEQLTKIYTGNIFLGDSTQKVVATIIATNKKSNEEYTFVPNSKTGKYVMALVAGEYMITLISDGYETIHQKLEVNDIGSNQEDTKMNFTLKKK